MSDKQESSDKQVSKRLADTLNLMRELLRDEFKSDFAYTIMANGHIVAASNKRDGVIVPSTN